MTSNQQCTPGDLFCFGRNLHGQLGLGHTTDVQMPARLVLRLASGQRAVQVFCAYEHNFVLTSNDEVFAFGKGSKGQLGLGNTEDRTTPQRIHLLNGRGIKDVVGGVEHTLALTHTGEVYSWGCNAHGQLGLGQSTPKELTPQKVPSLCALGATQLACGRNHALVLTADGQVHAMGDNRWGQLGVQADGEPAMVVASTPQRVLALRDKTVVQMACGADFSAAVTREGALFVWGDNSEGQLGVGNREHQYSPVPVPTLKRKHVVQVSCGKRHLVCLTKQDDIYVMGSNQCGQLGLDTPENQVLPRRLLALGGKCVLYISCGKDTTFIKTDRGLLYVMGSTCQLGLDQPPISGGGANPGGDAAGEGATLMRPVLHPFVARMGTLSTAVEVVTKGGCAFFGVGLLGLPGGSARTTLKDSLVKDLGGLLTKESLVALADASFTVGEAREPQRLHKAVLRARCPKLHHLVAEAGGGAAHLPESVSTCRYLAEFLYQGDAMFRNRDLHHDSDDLEGLFALMNAGRTYGLTRLQGLCEKRVEALMAVDSVHRVLRLSADGGFLYLTRQCLQFALDHFGQVTDPSNTLSVVRELGEHPEVLASLLGLSAAYKAGAKAAPCITELPNEPTELFDDGYQDDFDRYFQETVRACAQPPGEAMAHEGGETGAPAGLLADPPDGTDFCIRLGEGGQSLRAHRCLLAARSGFFAGLLGGCSSMAEAANGEVVLQMSPPPTPEALRSFLRFLYTARCDNIDPISCLDILAFTRGDEGSGGFLQVLDNDQLRAICTETLYSSICQQNVLPLLCRAALVSDCGAQAAAMEFLLSHFAEVVTSEEAMACLQRQPEIGMDIIAAVATKCSVTYPKVVDK